MKQRKDNCKLATGVDDLELIIRRARSEDYEAVNAIIRFGQEEHAAALPDHFARLDHVVAMGWYRSFSDQMNKVIWVAEKSGQVVGVAMLEMKKSPSYEALVPRTYAYLNELAVSPTFSVKALEHCSIRHLQPGRGNKGLPPLSLMFGNLMRAPELSTNLWG